MLAPMRPRPIIPSCIASSLIRKSLAHFSAGRQTAVTASIKVQSPSANVGWM
jgi:hypothetical protein